MSRTVLVGCVTLLVIGLERAFWWLIDSIWRANGALDHFALVHEPSFVLATLSLGSSVVLGLATAAAFFGLRWWPAAIGGALAALPELVIALICTSGLASISFNWFWIQVGRLEALCHYPGRVIYDVALGYSPPPVADHWLFTAGLSNPVGSEVVVPLYWVTWLSGFSWACLLVTAVTLFVHWRDSP